jgi:hypothetical protein
MKKFNQILQSMGLTNGTTRVTLANAMPPLVCKYRPAGGGYQEAIIVELNSETHVTIFKTTWDDTGNIPDYDRQPVEVGPYCLHLTTNINDGTTPTVQRWFYNVELPGSLTQVADHGDTSQRARKVVNTIFDNIKGHLL